MQIFQVKRRGHLLSTFNHEETPVDAPPKGSSDEEDDQTHESSLTIKRDNDSPSGSVRTTRNKQGVRYEEATSSDENDLPRGSISKTTFSTQRAVRSQIEQNSSRPKPNSKVTARRDAEHLPKPGKSRASASRTYSSKDRKSQMTQERLKTKVKASREDVSPEAPTFKLPFEITSPQKPQDRISGFVAPARSKHSSPLKATQFRNPIAGIDSSSSDPSTRATFKRLPKGSDSDADSMSDSKRPRTAAVSLRKSKRRSTEVSADLSQPPAFKIPGIISENAEKLENFSNDDFTVEAPETSIHGLSTGPDQASVCPYCREPVKASSPQEFSNGVWMSLREKQAFCVSHKKASAQESWETRGYPRIDWDKLDDRIGRHDAHLQRILRGEKSYFGDKLLEHIKSGEERTLLKSKHIVGPGYYGPRGMRMLQEHIIRMHSSLLRQRAVKDRVVAARGYGHYVQAVLVPELATQLIMEDMNVSPEDARKIMVESIKVGELLNEDTADVAATQADDSE